MDIQLKLRLLQFIEDKKGQKATFIEACSCVASGWGRECKIISNRVLDSVLFLNAHNASFAANAA